MRILTLSLLLAGFGVVAAAPAATVYKWVDEKGVVNYTTTPPDKRKSATVDTAPAVEGKALPLDYNEARYWRERSQREALRELREERQRGETEALRQARLRQEMAAADAQARQKSFAQLVQEQCRSERRVDCENGGYAASMAYAYPPVAVITRPAGVITIPPTTFSVTSNFTPGFSKPLVYSNPR